ncbi:MAG: DUF4129 domain-containing protein [Acidimicrobiales bacterium]
MGLPPATQDPAAVRELADRILAEARFDRPAESIPDRIMGWLGEQLARAFGNLVSGGGGTAVAWVILLAAVGGVVYLLVRYGRMTLPSLATPDEPEVMVELTRSAREWRAEADRLEAADRWPEGLRCRHRALVADLVRRGAIPEQAGRTAGEYVRDVAGSLPDAAPAMAAATELFEAVWYGGAATGAAEAARFTDLDARVLGVRV